MNKYNEVEYKFRTPLKKITDLVDGLSRLGTITGLKNSDGTDYYYIISSLPKSFIRHRISQDQNELTVKKFLQAKDTVNRLEVDLKLNQASVEDINTFLSILQAQFIFLLTKHVLVVFLKEYPDVIFSIAQINEEDLFVEIEMKKDEPSTIKARLQKLDQCAQSLLSLNLITAPREERSFFEIYCPFPLL